jgi:hypothetical protein
LLLKKQEIEEVENQTNPNNYLDSLYMGKKVAENKGYHYSAEVWENDSGEYYVVIQKDLYKRRYRKNYYPIANRMYFPEIWSKKKGAQLLLNQLIESDELLLKKTAERLDKLKRCRETINKNWDDEIAST